MGMPRNYLKARRALEETNSSRASRPKIQITNEDGGLRVNIYDEIGPWGVNASDFVRDFGALDPGDKPVHVHINSPGGDVYDGLAIYQTLKSSPSQIHVHIDGLAASAASFIAMAGDEIEIGRNARMMIHDASTIVYGNAADMRETAEWLDEESDNIADIYSQKAGGTAADWRAVMIEEKWYSADQAVEAGLADSIHGADNASSGVAASLFRNAPSLSPGGPAQPANTHTDEADPFDGIDLGQVSSALKEAFR